LPANTEITGEFHETHHLARAAARDNSAPSKAYKANSLRAITGNFQEQIREGMAGAGKNGVASEGVGLAFKEDKITAGRFAVARAGTLSARGVRCGRQRLGPSRPATSATPRQDLRKPRLEFLEELRRLNGMPTEVLGNAELVDLILPALRADFKAIELYRYIKERPLACQIVAYGGAGDEEVLETELLAWREQTASRFSHRMFAGGHFYLRTVADEFVARLRVGFAEFMHSALPLKGDPPLRAPFSVP
jgi:Thioesterase domain